MQQTIRKPLNAVFDFLKDKSRVEVWLQHDNHTRIEGVLVGYDEFFNIILEDAVEHNTRRPNEPGFPLGKLILKGDTVGLVHRIGN
jgi:small nuclear ribonucleoprotein E